MAADGRVQPQSGALRCSRLVPVLVMLNQELPGYSRLPGIGDLAREVSTNRLQAGSFHSARM